MVKEGYELVDCYIERLLALQTVQLDRDCNPLDILVCRVRYQPQCVSRLAMLSNCLLNKARGSELKQERGVIFSTLEEREIGGAA